MNRVLLILTVLFSVESFAAGDCSCNKPLADIVAPLLPAVVNVSTTHKNIAIGKSLKSILPDEFPFEGFFEKFGVPGIENDGIDGALQISATGSGFIIDASGLIVTNHHVIVGADKIFVKLYNGTELEAELVGSDSKTDLALLKVKSTEPLSFTKFGNSDVIRAGDSVVTIGNPFGLGGTVTAGIVSAPSRDINSGTLVDNFIQTDASINQGNSGGPLFNMNGEVIGINTSIVSSSGGNIGIAFAVPSSFAAPIIEQIKNGGKVKRGWLGIVMRPASNFAESMGIEENSGAIVVSVSKNSPAAKAGIEVGDIVLEFDGKKITNEHKLPKIVAETKVGNQVNIVLLSNGKKKTIAITLVETDGENEKLASKELKNEGDKHSSKKIIGMQLVELDDNLRQEIKIQEKLEGLYISEVADKSEAKKNGIKAGDIIIMINQQHAKKIESFEKVLETATKSGRKSVMLTIYRKGAILPVQLLLSKES